MAPEDRSKSRRNRKSDHNSGEYPETAAWTIYELLLLPFRILFWFKAD